MFVAAMLLAGCRSKQQYVADQDPAVDRIRSLMTREYAVVAVHEVLWKNRTTSVDAREIVPTPMGGIVVNQQSFRFTSQVDTQRLKRRPNVWVTDVLETTATTTVPFDQVDTLLIENRDLPGRQNASVVTISNRAGKQDAIAILIIATEDRAKLTAALQVLSPALMK